MNFEDYWEKKHKQSPDQFFIMDNMVIINRNQRNIRTSHSTRQSMKIITKKQQKQQKQPQKPKTTSKRPMTVENFQQRKNNFMEVTGRKVPPAQQQKRRIHNQDSTRVSTDKQSSNQNRNPFFHYYYKKHQGICQYSQPKLKSKNNMAKRSKQRKEKISSQHQSQLKKAMVISPKVISQKQGDTGKKKRQINNPRPKKYTKKHFIIKPKKQFWKIKAKKRGKTQNEKKRSTKRGQFKSKFKIVNQRYVIQKKATRVQDFLKSQTREQMNVYGNALGVLGREIL